MKKTQQNRPVTTDDIAELSGMISTNFTRINEQFQKVDKKFEEVNEQFQEVRENFQQVRNDILQLDQRFPTLHAFDKLSQRVVSLEERSKTQ